MNISKTKLNGVLKIEPTVYVDDRGRFAEVLKYTKSGQIVEGFVPVQENESWSRGNVLRGLHFQKGVHAQAKLVRVVYGSVKVAVVDLRKNSTTYSQTETFDISDKTCESIFIPRGLAHGFFVRSEFAIFNYKVDNFYNKESEAGIIYNDECLNIDWGIDESSKGVRLSRKDKNLPKFTKLDYAF